ncbi:DUF6338 family protein [Pseudomonas synxantha]|uniref:DUF6338 family protein n=1 Tax=Pseudomonas synxantha TaxID=47883 RepID=UPI00099BD26A|nr:DUF6338 family protein [Pseudomonas synxantha]OPB02366.1 hypothetical protein BFW89_15130 [Pseudomonas synxantha]
MDDLVKEIIPLLQYLIPGFLTAWIFYSFTAFKRPDTFGQIVQALIFTFIIQEFVGLIESLSLWIGVHVGSIGEWTTNSKSVWSGVIAIGLGAVSCHFACNDKLHKWLREKGITKKTSHPTEWYSAFTEYPRFVVLHLHDDRRIYGWPLHWPTEPKEGQFVIQDPSWLESDGTEIPMAVEIFTIDVTRVQWVEFTIKNW